MAMCICSGGDWKPWSPNAAGDHPRWPSTSPIRRRFPNWSKAPENMTSEEMNEELEYLRAENAYLKN